MSRKRIAGVGKLIEHGTCLLRKEEDAAEENDLMQYCMQMGAEEYMPENLVVWAEPTGIRMDPPGHPLHTVAAHLTREQRRVCALECLQFVALMGDLTEMNDFALPCVHIAEPHCRFVGLNKWTEAEHALARNTLRAVAYLIGAYKACDFLLADYLSRQYTARATLPMVASGLCALWMPADPAPMLHLLQGIYDASPPTHVEAAYE